MSRLTLAEVVEPRYHELFELVLDEIRHVGIDEQQLAAGIVLTGGAAKMEGVAEFAEGIFQVPVRVGSPMRVRGLTDYINDPSYATAVGLLHYGREETQLQSKEKRSGDGVSGLWNRVQSWFKGEF